MIIFRIGNCKELIFCIAYSAFSASIRAVLGFEIIQNSGYFWEFVCGVFRAATVAKYIFLKIGELFGSFLRCLQVFFEKRQEFCATSGAFRIAGSLRKLFGGMVCFFLRTIGKCCFFMVASFWAMKLLMTKSPVYNEVYSSLKNSISRTELHL